MKKTYLAGILASVLISLAGCKAIEGSGTQDVRVDSFPKGATVYVNGALVEGKTPVDVTLSRKGSYDVVIKREGFQDIEQKVENDPTGTSIMGYGTLSPRVINAFLICDYVAGAADTKGDRFEQMKEATAWAKDQSSKGKLDKYELKYVNDQIAKHFASN